MLAHTSLLLWMLSALIVAVLSETNTTWSTSECRPLVDPATDIETSCVDPHPLMSDCSGVSACCPGYVIKDWRTQNNTCKHGGFPGSKTTPTVQNSDAEAVDDPVDDEEAEEAIELEEASAFLRSASSTPLAICSIIITAIQAVN